MNTVYIKSDRGFVNADQIESIAYNEKKNKIYIMIGQTEEQGEYLYEIYSGKAVNCEEAVIKILSLINEAKLVSSEKQKAVILEFFEDIDNHKAFMIDKSELNF